MSLIEIENIEIFGIIYMRSKINYIINYVIFKADLYKIPDLYKLVFNILKFHNLIT